MKNSILLLFCAALITGCFGSLSKKESGVDQDYLNKQKKADIAQKAIDSNKSKVSDKAKSFVHATVYTLNQETNRTPEVDTASEFARYAQLTLGNPSIEDARKIEEIADGIIKEYQSKNLKLQLENASTKEQSEKLKEALKKAESEGSKARAELNSFQNEIIKLQNNEDILKKKYQSELDKLNQENLDNAEKAKAWDADHGFWSSFNIFSDIFSLIKKLFTLSIICVVLFVIFKVVEIFCPALSVVSGIGAMMLNILKKIIPAAFAGAGFVSSKVLDTLKHVVQSNHSFMKTLKELPIEDDLIVNYPDNYTFSKKEVKDLLLALTDKTLQELENELNKNTNEVTKGVVTNIKQEIKGEKPANLMI